jgi:predicted nuclease of predicted toxin-antitoxin system
LKLLVDMNLSPAWVSVLKQAGHDAIHWSAVGAPGAEDGELMAWARQRGYVVLTNDLDFSTILAATSADGPSVFQVRTQALSPRRLGAVLLSALDRFEENLLAGALVTMDEARARVRILPLKPKDKA